MKSKKDSPNYTPRIFFAVATIIKYVCGARKETIMTRQIEFQLEAKGRGFHLITSEILRHLPQLPEAGLLNLFVKHTSCALTINENADPDVRTDMEKIFNRLVPENQPYYDHVLEGRHACPRQMHARRNVHNDTHNQRKTELGRVARNLPVRIPRFCRQKNHRRYDCKLILFNRRFRAI